MKTKILALVAAAALSVPFAPNARAHEGHEDGHSHRQQVYTVSYHLDGERSYQAENHDHADKWKHRLRDLGASVHVHGNHRVHYHLDGSRSRSFASDRAAHEFAAWLRSLGFHADVRH